MSDAPHWYKSHRSWRATWHGIDLEVKLNPPDRMLRYGGAMNGKHCCGANSPAAVRATLAVMARALKQHLNNAKEQGA